MINLDIKPYCQNCNEFEAECLDVTPEYCVVKSFEIRCKYASKCEHICDYLARNARPKQRGEK